MMARTRQLSYVLITVVTAFLGCPTPAAALPNLGPADPQQKGAAAAQKAPAAGTNVAGKVVDPSGAVIIGATVTLAAGDPRLQTTSDSLCLYHVGHVPPGAH